MSDEKISKALEIEYESKPKEIVVDKKQLQEIKKQQRETLLNTDFDTARNNKDLIDIHKKTNEAEKQNVTVTNTTNNSIYVGSTTDLQNLLNKSRSQFKPSDDVIDVGDENAEQV